MSTGRRLRRSSSTSPAFEPHGFRLTRSVELDIDAFEHSGQIARDLRIPEANDAIAFVLEPALPCTIALGRVVFVVVTTVELDDEAFGWAEEVDDIGADRRLSAEVRAFSWKLLQRAS